MIGYKEWEGVCEALGSGRQVLLLRKGGIHEGRAGFSFKHERFVLFPTRFHAQAAQLREPCTAHGGEWEVGDEVPITLHCSAMWARTLTDWEIVNRLAEFHVWSEDLVRERFDWGGEDGSIHCALVRVARFARPWSLTYEKRHGGCRTWVELPGLTEERMPAATPVIGDAEFGELRARIEDVVGA